MPVTSGFTSATSIIIIISQLQGLLGLKFKAHNIVDNLRKIFQNIENIRIADLILGFCSIVFLLFFRVSFFKIIIYKNKIIVFNSIFKKIYKKKLKINRNLTFKFKEFKSETSWDFKTFEF